ncbi:MAG TPA: RsmE family RNA methyltransferase [Bacteroidales bacterium]|nr:RsmE family RNA methyltransferase [Bacteroidales bacterium]
MELFYEPQISVASNLPFSTTLNKEESWHCAKVLRMRSGDIVLLTNGSGRLFHGILKSIDPEGCQIQIHEIEIQKPKKYFLHLAVSPIKQMHRFEWFVEKATEIGVDRITPLICARTEKVSVRTDRLKKIMIAAMKQSLGAYLPTICEPVDLISFVKQRHEGQRFFGCCGKAISPLLGTVLLPEISYTVLIGPEGDFSESEVNAVQKEGFSPISFGTQRLRTETAALAACFTANFVNAMNDNGL